MAKRKRRAFTKEFKAETVRLVRESGKSVGGGGAGAGSHRDGAAGWVRQAEIDAGRGPAGALTTEEREELGRLRRESPDAADGARHPKKSDGLLRQGERVKFAFIAAEKAAFPVRVLCRTLEVSRAGFYAWQARPAGAADAGRTSGSGVEIAAIHAESRQRYGSPRVHAELRDRGRRASRKRVARLMRAARALAARRRRRFRVTTDSQASACPSRPTSWRGSSPAPRPTQAWVTDITYIWTRRGLAVPGGHPRSLLARRRRLGHERAASRGDLTLAGARPWRWGAGAPRRACCITRIAGSQYASARLPAGPARPRDRLQHEPPRQLLGQRRRRELLRDAEGRARRTTRPGRRAAQARGELFEYIELFYNGQRRHSALGYLSPLAFERQWAARRRRHAAASPPIAGGPRKARP